MIIQEHIKLVDKFPHPGQNRFDKPQWLNDHGQSNVIINCNAREIYYGDHWTPLSLKCAFNGKEFYRSGNALQCASDETYLIYNEGKEYTSFISSEHEVESLTINFSEKFVSEMLNTFQLNAEKNMDQLQDLKMKRPVHFFERAYAYTPGFRNQVLQIRELIKDFKLNRDLINESLFALFESILVFQEGVNLEVNHLQAVKNSTRVELYKRLHMTKDLMDSSFQQNITLETLAEVALINPYYLLRLFRDYYKTTPRQYLKKVRITEAKKLLLTGLFSVSQVCHMVGFSDISSFSKLFKAETGISPSLFSGEAPGK